jgi:hypothetical protein
MTPVVSHLAVCPDRTQIPFPCDIATSKAALDPHYLLSLGHLCRQVACDACSHDLLLFLDVFRKGRILNHIYIA